MPLEPRRMAIKMSAGAKIIRFTNKLFKPVVHPFNLASNGDKTYAEWQYDKGGDTIKFFTEKYKPHVLFEGKTVLDVGCGAAGKSLYYLKMGADRVTGVDIVESYEREAMALAAKLGYTRYFNFVCASADELPYPDNSFDTIIMNDAMEHVSKPEAVLLELRRVVKPNGHVFINFPPYYHPFGAHLSDAINMPWVHCFFSENACIEAYRELVADKPDAKQRINFRITTDVSGRDHITYINKMTVSRFRRILRELNIQPQYYREVPLRGFLAPLAKIPAVKEPFVKMVVAVLTKENPAPIKSGERKSI